MIYFTIGHMTKAMLPYDSEIRNVVEIHFYFLHIKFCIGLV